MEQVIVSGFRDWAQVAVVEYNHVAGGERWRTVENHVYAIVSTPGVLKNFFVRLATAPGGAASWTYVVRVNGISPVGTPTVTIVGAATQGSDLVNEVAVAAGDRVAIMCTPAGGPAGGYYTLSLMFVGDNARESLILGGSYTSLDSATTEYSTCGGMESWLALESDVYQIISTNGVIKNLYLWLDASPGVAPDAYRFTLMLNGAPTTLQVTVTAPATTGNDVANQIVVAPGDRIDLRCEPLNGPAATPRAHWGMTFVADIDGEALLLGGTDSPLFTGAINHYMHLNCAGWEAWGTPETQWLQLGQECVIRNLYLWLTVAPGVGNSYAFTMRQNLGNTLLAVTIAGGATTGNDVADDIVIADFDYLTLQSFAAGGPAASQAHWGLTVFRQPPAVPPSGVSILAAAEVILDI